MIRRSAGALTALGILAALAAVLALAAEAGTGAQSAPSAVLHAADGSAVHGGVSFIPTPITQGTSAALTIHGLPPNAYAHVRLHTGRSLAEASTTSVALPGGRVGKSGSLRAYGQVHNRNGSDVRITDITDGAHMVLVYANDSLVAYAHIPRG